MVISLSWGLLNRLIKTTNLNKVVEGYNWILGPVGQG